MISETHATPLTIPPEPLGDQEPAHVVKLGAAGDGEVEPEVISRHLPLGEPRDHRQEPECLTHGVARQRCPP